MTLREARQAKGITQDALARSLGLQRPAITGYESGRRMPSAARARQIEQVLGVPPGSIVWSRPKEDSA